MSATRESWRHRGATRCRVRADLRECTAAPDRTTRECIHRDRRSAVLLFGRSVALACRCRPVRKKTLLSTLFLQPPTMPPTGFETPALPPSLWLTTGPRIPTEGSVPLDVLARHLRALCADGSLITVARSVLARDGDDFGRVATAVLPIPADDARASRQMVTVGALTLVSVPLTPKELCDGNALASTLASAFPGGDGLQRALMQPLAAYVSRSWAREIANGALATWPLWRARFDGIRQRRMSLPRGPFFNPHVGRFYTSVRDATTAWIGIPLLQEHESTVDDVYYVLLPDPRAYLEDVRVVDGGVEVRVSGTLVGTQAQLYCALAGTDMDGRSVEQFSLIRNRAVAFRFERQLRECAIHVLDADGVPYDQHIERDFRAALGDSLFTGDGGARVARARNLTLALESGEGEHVEFKEWIPENRADSKSAELLKCAVAFANAEGGTIFIGVSDQGDLVGVERPLRKEYAKAVGGDLTRLRDAYYADLRERLLTAVRPRLEVRLVWIDPTPDAWVLAVQVEHGGREAHFVERTIESFARRGATNRRASPEDIRRMQRDRERER